jgi:hypothetical protein
MPAATAVATPAREPQALPHREVLIVFSGVKAFLSPPGLAPSR